MDPEVEKEAKRLLDIADDYERLIYEPNRAERRKNAKRNRSLKKRDPRG